MGPMTDQRWRQILRIMDEAYADYLRGMAAWESASWTT